MTSAGLVTFCYQSCNYLFDLLPPVNSVVTSLLTSDLQNTFVNSFICLDITESRDGEGRRRMGYFTELSR